MKITKETLKQIIKEEIQTVLNEQKRELSPESAATHAKNLDMANDERVSVDDLAKKMKLPKDFKTINDYKTYVGPFGGKLARAIRLAMRSPAARKIAGKKM